MDSYTKEILKKKIEDDEKYSEMNIGIIRISRRERRKAERDKAKMNKNKPFS
jgi:hypothetical protein